MLPDRSRDVKRVTSRRPRRRPVRDRRRRPRTRRHRASAVGWADSRPSPPHPPGRRTTPHGTAVLVLLFVVAPLVELAVIVQVAGTIGALNTIGLLIPCRCVGAWLAKREGVGVLRRIQAALDRGEMPSNEVVDGGLILLAGALMIAPGFISDVPGPPAAAPAHPGARAGARCCATSPRPGPVAGTSGGRGRRAPRRRRRRRRVGRRELGGPPGPPPPAASSGDAAVTADDTTVEQPQPKPIVYGVAGALSPMVRRIVADNPGMMTGPGTNTYLVGIDEIAVIDPGPGDAAHLDAIAGCGGDRIRWILLTHTHEDHSPGAVGLKKRTGAEILALRPRRGPGQGRASTARWPTTR